MITVFINHHNSHTVKMPILHKCRPLHLINRQACAKLFSCCTRRTSATTTANNGTKPTHSVKPFSEMPEALSGPRFISMFYFIYLYITKKSPVLTSYYTMMKQKHGDIWKQNINIGKGDNNYIVMVGHPDYAKTVFQAPETEHRRFKLQLIDVFTKKNNFPKSMALLDGKEWEERRKPTQEKMLRPAVVANYVPLIEKVTNDFIEKLERKEKTEDLFTDLLNYATESVGMLCFNKRLGCLENDNNPVAVHVRKIFEMLGTSVMTPRKSHMSPDSRFFKEYEKHTFEFVKIAKEILDSQKIFLSKMKDEEKLEKYLEEEPNFMYSLLSDPRVTEESATSMVTSLFGAGIETSANTLTFVLTDLSLYPDKQKKLYEEIQRVVGESRNLSKEHLAQMSYLKACVKESLRRTFPLSSGTGRYLETDLKVGGYEIPKDTFVVVNSALMCKDERFFPRPTEFIPERWLRDTEGELMKSRNFPFAYNPFGYGQRSCLGQRFAENEIFIAVTKIIQNFQISLPAGVTEVKSDYTLFRTPSEKVTLYFKKRGISN
ncbi:1,25-dihydroxyvitamin D(3) 24-hydroxylase, mitochondrial-like isoform X4 [Mytilus californianus]|uniref:1,25-dihydroxyvitamin D(3) 24-hydroxylase, mitochondrial-like isoform X4 n=1 Tax=Mytilus californianus TaxID=6549 RepID=UPI002247ADF2|nr:1,25-dihydroxyvitamin D(3) 24-hydroxylase, mitochondrial-like isoform X4 [Mytilus californianus]